MLTLATTTSHELVGLSAALAIGLLLGVERERRKGAGPTRGSAGIRTFVIVALTGGVAQIVGGVAVVAVAGAFVGLAALASYVRDRSDDPGMTTETALVLAFLLGALAQRNAQLAAGIGVGIGLALANRDRLHRLVRNTLTEQELHDALLFAAAALIVLPLVPDVGVGPHKALNPLTVWRFVVLVMAIQGLGYIALRIIGPRFGLLASGFVSGFVSSTASVGTMGARASAQPTLRRAAVGGAVASTVPSLALLVIVVGATSEKTLQHIALPVTLAGVAALAYALLVAWRVYREPVPGGVDRGRAFDLRVAVLLAALISVVLLIAGVLRDALGVPGVIIGATVAGFADLQSAAVSAAALAASGRITPAQATIPVLAGLTANSLTKAGVAYGFGKRQFATDVWIGLALVVAAGWGGYSVLRAVGG